MPESEGPSDPTFDVTITGGGGTSGGSSGGGSSSGSGSSSASAAQAKAEAERKRVMAARKALRGVLLGLRVHPGPFMDLVDRAAKQSLSSAEFLYSVTKTKQFRKMFPGISSLFKQGLSVGSAIGEWRQQAVAYRDAANTLGIQENLNRNKVGWLVKNNVSADEYAQRLIVKENLDLTDPLRQMFNQLLTQKQKQQLDKVGWGKFLTGQLADRDLYDLFEAAQLGVSGLDITPQEALGVAKGLGKPGELVGDLGELVQRVRAIEDFVKPELQREGVSSADLLMLEGGSDPRGLAPAIERVIKAHESVGEPTAAPARRRASQTGTPTLFGGSDEGL